MARVFRSFGLRQQATILHNIESGLQLHLTQPKRRHAKLVGLRLVIQMQS
jgi:ABC-type proline/glycine betaine transport system ATPase subunit